MPHFQLENTPHIIINEMEKQPS